MRLPELRQNDLRLISDFSAGMMDCRDTIEQEEYLHTHLRTVVDGDSSVWCLVTLNGEMPYGSAAPLMGERFWNSVVPVIAGFLREHPCLHALQRERPLVHASKTTDQPTYKDFLSSILYNEGYCRWDCHYMADGAVQVSDDSYLIIQINRSSRDFSSRDLQVFKKLIPHAANVFHLLKRREHLEMALKEGFKHSPSINRFWLSISSLLYIKNSSANAQTMLRELFPGQHSLVELPALLKGNLREVIKDWPSGVGEHREFELVSRDERICFELRQIDPLTYKLTGTLPDRKEEASPGLVPSGSSEELTKRELDVLGWVLEGKTTPEIAILLGIRPKTVESHLRGLYGKLGVRSRMELIQGWAGN